MCTYKGMCITMCINKNICQGYIHYNNCFRSINTVNVCFEHVQKSCENTNYLL